METSVAVGSDALHRHLPRARVPGRAAGASGPGGYVVEWAATAAEVQDAQRLRHRVFVEELGARLDSPLTGRDVEPFDAYCDHLLVRRGGEVVGTFRLLSPGRCDRLHSDDKFDLTPLTRIRPDLVEVGRMCVHPGHRDGAVLGLMGTAIARHMAGGGYGWLAGYCSVALGDGGRTAAAIMDRVEPGPYRVTPRLPWRDPGVPRPDRFAPPPLLRACLRAGAWICGPPAHDPGFDTADFFVLLSMARVTARYLRIR